MGMAISSPAGVSLYAFVPEGTTYYYLTGRVERKYAVNRNSRHQGYVVDPRGH